MTFKNNQIRNLDLQLFKPLNNSRLGVSVKIMPSKIKGCFQSNFSSVKISIDNYCIGKTCNGSDFSENESMVKNIVLNYYNKFEGL